MEYLSVLTIMVGFYKYLSTMKMMVMMMSMELCSIFLFFLLVFFSSMGSGLFLSTYSIFLILVVCEGVIVLMSMINIYRKGSGMIKSLVPLKI